MPPVEHVQRLLILIEKPVTEFILQDNIPGVNEKVTQETIDSGWWRLVSLLRLTSGESLIRSP
jgi:hypothetical protein